VFDLICASDKKLSLLLHNVSARSISGNMISHIVNTVDKISGIESGIGIGLESAFQLAARRSDVGMGREIVVLTDALIMSGAQRSTVSKAVMECENIGINVLSLGLGIAPIHLLEIFPLCLYCPSPSKLNWVLQCHLLWGFQSLHLHQKRLNLFMFLLLFMKRNFQNNKIWFVKGEIILQI
jgi:hypothetical protein